MTEAQGRLISKRLPVASADCNERGFEARELEEACAQARAAVSTVKLHEGSEPSDEGRGVAVRGFVHKRESIAVRILEKRHPEVVILHGRYETGLAGKSDPALFKFANGEGNVRTAEVDRRAVDSFP